MSNRTLAALAALLASAAPLAAVQEAEVIAPDSGAYRIFTGSGQVASLEQLVADADAVDVVFLGESHNDVVGHRLQFEIFSRLLGQTAVRSGDAVAPFRLDALSLEMFERDVQYIVDEYLADLITADQFKRSARPWTFYDEDYAPTVEAAKAAGLPVLAANAPRRYVNIVSREGPDALAGLSAEAMRYLAPLPHAPPSEPYRAELAEVMGQHGAGTAGPPAPSEKTLMAQSLWDATMAYSIAEELLRNPGVRVTHMVGSFHVKNGTGIPEQLARYRPGTRTLIVYVEPVEDVTAFPAELEGAGDFVILTDQARVRATQTTGSGQD